MKIICAHFTVSPAEITNNYRSEHLITQIGVIHPQEGSVWTLAPCRDHSASQDVTISILFQMKTASAVSVLYLPSCFNEVHLGNRTFQRIHNAITIQS